MERKAVEQEEIETIRKPTAKSVKLRKRFLLETMVGEIN
jgi:hypothetical protein